MHGVGVDSLSWIIRNVKNHLLVSRQDQFWYLTSGAQRYWAGVPNAIYVRIQQLHGSFDSTRLECQYRIQTVHSAQFNSR